MNTLYIRNTYHCLKHSENEKQNKTLFWLRRSLGVEFFANNSQTVIAMTERLIGFNFFEQGQKNVFILFLLYSVPYSKVILIIKVFVKLTLLSFWANQSTCCQSLFDKFWVVEKLMLVPYSLLQLISVQFHCIWTPFLDNLEELLDRLANCLPQKECTLYVGTGFLECVSRGCVSKHI